MVGQVHELIPQGVPYTRQGIFEGTLQPFDQHTMQTPSRCRLQWSSATESQACIHSGRPLYRRNTEAHLAVHPQHNHTDCGITTTLNCRNRCGQVEHGISVQDVK